MNFFKKFFGKKDDDAQANAPQGDAPETAPQGGSVKEDHDNEHPNGGGGKNVCEFC